METVRFLWLILGNIYLNSNKHESLINQRKLPQENIYNCYNSLNQCCTQYKIIAYFQNVFTKGRGEILLVFFKVVHLGNMLQLRLSTLKACVNNWVIPDVLVGILVIDTRIQPAISMDLVFAMLSFQFYMDFCQNVLMNIHQIADQCICIFEK